MSAVRILLVDDHEVVRIGLRTLLGHHANLEVVGEAANAEEAVTLASRLRPEVVLMDIRLPGRSGIEACAEITRQCPNTRVIVLTSFAEDNLLFDAIAAGAVGYALKQVGSESLIRAIEAASRGESLLDPTLLGRVMARVRQSAARERHEVFSSLSEQELRIMALLATGKANKEIGHILGLSEKTVRNYVSNVLAKLHLASRAEAAAFAVRHHLNDSAERLAEP